MAKDKKTFFSCRLIEIEEENTKSIITIKLFSDGMSIQYGDGRAIYIGEDDMVNLGCEIENNEKFYE